MVDPGGLWPERRTSRWPLTSTASPAGTLALRQLLKPTLRRRREHWVTLCENRSPQSLEA
jgi:hypothetical protein